jgi:hypothetical protein
VERAREVGVDVDVPQLVAHLLERRHDAHRSVGDEDVEPAELLHDPVHDAIHLGAVADVGEQSEAA